MLAKDLFHDAVKNALIKSGWTLKNENFELKLLEDNYENGSEFVQIFEKDGEKIAVLIEQFLSASQMEDFYFAFGRYLNCRLFLSKINPELVLYSAITLEVNNNIFKKRFISKMISDYKIKLIIYDYKTQELKGWNKNTRIMSPHLVNKEDAKRFEKRVEIDL